MASEYLINEIVNDDGTPFDPPENPLMEKWLKEYPPTKMPEFSSVCDGYSCMYCSRCPKGENWVVPEEDLEEHRAYVREYNKYMLEHNPSLAKYFDDDT